MMLNPTESDPRSGDAQVSPTRTQYHREHYQQEESAPQTSYQPVANQMLTGMESVNRNHSLTSTASPSLPASADPQQSPRIGAVPTRPAAASPPSDSLLATARRYVQRADVDWCKPFIKTRRRYVDRCSVPFEWDNRWHSAVFFQSSEHEFKVHVRDQKTGELRASCSVNVVIEFVDAPADA